MKKHPPLRLLIFILCALFLSCDTSYRTTALTFSEYRISAAQQQDSTINAVIKPYREEINKTMNDVVGIADKSLDKRSPESSLGNFMVDAFFVMAKEKYNTQVDAAFLNSGGIRLTQLPAGNVTRGKIFELMPFDNLLILQKLNGEVLQQLLDLTAAQGGWPLAGITMQIKDKKAINVQIGGKPIDPKAIYTTANSDFVANGGSDANMLRTIPQITNGYLMRDAIFDYIDRLKSQGRNISANEENRVTHAQ